MESKLNIPEGHQAVMPYIITREPGVFLEFLKKAFGATEKLKVMNQEGTNVQHGEATVFGSCIMFASPSDKFAEEPSGLTLSVADIDIVYKSALNAGATSLMEPADYGFGKFGGFKDQSGNTWWLVESKPQVEKETQAHHQGEGVWCNLALKDAASFLEFLKKVFHAEEKTRKEQDGRIMHAETSISGGVIMCSEYSEQRYSYGGGGIFVYVSNTDETHKLALAEGATEVLSPADQGSGRSSAIKDPFGNKIWITSAPSKN